MTGFTHIRGGDVRGTHAGGSGAIVTSNTSISRGAVIKHDT